LLRVFVVTVYEYNPKRFTRLYGSHNVSPSSCSHAQR
jgi:hypothetical protein